MIFCYVKILVKNKYIIFHLPVSSGLNKLNSIETKKAVSGFFFSISNGYVLELPSQRQLNGTDQSIH